jgi:hypothetical protein
MIRLLCAGLLALCVVACDGPIECEALCSDSGSKVVRTFPSCSALRDEIERRVSSETISQCEAEALETCEKASCEAVPL